jgi:hypothetical protein
VNIELANPERAQLFPHSAVQNRDAIQVTADYWRMVFNSK